MARKKKEESIKKRLVNFLAGGIFVILFIVLIQGSAPVWQTDSNYTLSEEDNYVHDLRNNITGYDGDVIFAINPIGQSIYWTNQLGRNTVNESIISQWISITDESGNLTINATRNNQTGFFEVPIKATNTSDTSEAPTRYLYFTINATNDAPIFANLNATYLIPEPRGYNFTINASDEENHYPLSFSFNFTSCELAEWSSRKNESGEDNCTLFGITPLSNSSFLVNFSVTRDDVGEYNMTFYVNDSGENYECPHEYCDSSTYKQNKSSFQTVTFKVLSSFDINASACNNTIVNEGDSLNCVINVTTIDLTENLSVWSNASLRNYAGPVLNRNWFYYNTSNQTSQQSIVSIPISVIPNRTEVGNWTINFSVRDSSGRVNSTSIFIFVNKTETGNVSIQSMPDINTSINLFNSTEVIAFDSDLLIPDKNESFGGYNETIGFSLELLDRDTLSPVQISSSNFNITPVADSNTLDNHTSALIKFFFNDSHPGNYTVRVNATDKGAISNNSTSFNLTVIPNTPPVWNNSKNYTFNFTVNSTRATTTGEIFANLVSDGWVNDSELNSISFSVAENSMKYFNLTSEGILNFTPYKEDVGFNQVTIYATDSWGLASSKTFYFNISNINSPPIIVQQPNLSVNESDVVFGLMVLTIFDEDLLITNETLKDSLTLDWTILDNSSQPVDLFNFSLFEEDLDDNFSEYYPSEFTPTRSDIGNYTIQTFVNDSSGSNDEMNFTLEIKRLYYTPEINYPEEGFVFNLTENSTSALIFNANHSATNKNLTYSFYVNGTLRQNVSSFGNGSNMTWNFKPNFTDETYGNLTNLTLIVSNPYENASRNFSLNVSHANAPVTFNGTIPENVSSYLRSILINLSEYFDDPDAFDSYYNQTVNFSAQSNSSSSNLTFVINDWVLNISSSGLACEILNITAEDLNETNNDSLTNVTSNNFKVTFIAPDIVPEPDPKPSGGGGGGTAPNTCVPSWNAEVGLCIKGLRNITYWDSKKCFANFTDTASCDDPGTIFQKLVFTEELITIEHPECIEAMEAVREAETLIDTGKIQEASEKLDAVVNWCRNSIAQSSEAAFTKPQEEPQRGLIWWVAVTFSISLFLEIIYYFIYRKVKLRRMANTKI